MERRRPPTFWPLFIVSLSMWITGLTGLRRAVEAADPATILGSLAWMLAGLAVMLVTDLREPPSRVRLAWLYVLAVAFLGVRMAGEYLALG